MALDSLARQFRSDQEGPGGNSYLGKYYTRLRIGQYQRPEPFGVPKFDPKIVVFLPIPNELRDDTAVGYTNVNLETVGDFFNGGGGMAAAAALRYSGQAVSAIGGGIATALGAAAGAAIGNDAAQRMVAGGLSKVGEAFPADQITSALQQTRGLAPNPNPSVMFQGPVLRDFSYTWAFYPKSAEESRDVQKLITVLKRSALPRNKIQNTAAVLSYPDMCQLNFFPWDEGGTAPWGWSEGSIIKYKKCMMQSVNVNYNPFGTPAFFEGTKLPVSYQLTIAFKEIEYLLSEDWAGTNVPPTVAGPVNERGVDADTFAGFGDTVTGLASDLGAAASRVTGLGDLAKALFSDTPPAQEPPAQ